MKTARKSLGKWGEDYAAQYLLQKGYSLRERNYRRARGELDIIAEKDGMLIFVEVKTARSTRMGDPITWVNRQKQAQLATVAMHYLQEKEIEDMDCRFDVIGILKQGEDVQIQHIENAFWLE